MSQAPDPRDAARFVGVIAQASLLLGLLLALANLAQAAATVLLPSDPLAALAPLGLRPPPWLAWLVAHTLALSLAGAALSLAFAGLSWALLRRRPWARRGFVAALVLGGLLNFALLPLIDPLFAAADALLPAFGPLDATLMAEARERLELLRPMVFTLTLLGTLAVAALHGWLAWRFCTPAVRAQFGR